MPRNRLWIVCLTGLICLLLLVLACQQQAKLEPVLHSPAIGAQALPTLVYDGHFPVGYPTVVPIIYVMHDYANRDWASVDPSFGPLGGWINWSWGQIHTGPNSYNWGVYDEYLGRAASLQVTLRDGAVIPKPVAISIQVYPEPGVDQTPAWVYASIPGLPTLNGKTVGQIIDPDGDGPCPAVAAPAWGNGIWQAAFEQMILALGQRYNNDPRINSVWITTGLYGETVVDKDLYTGCPTYQFGAGDFYLWVRNRVMPKYRDAFPTKPLYIISTGGGCLRRDTSAIAAQLPVRIGIKRNSLTYDVRGEYDILGCGKMETVNPYSVTNPIAFEHAFAANPWQVYWSTMNGLAHHADLFDFPYTANALDILNVLSMMNGMLHGYGQWEFIDRYLGRTLSNSPGVWIMFRDTQWPRNYGLNTGGRCLPYPRWDWGEEGRDWEFWLYRKNVDGGRTQVLAQPPNRDSQECDPVFPNIYSRYYQELPRSTQADLTKDYPWTTDSKTIREDVLNKVYGYYAVRRTDEPSDPYIYLDIDNAWAYWRNLPVSEPGGTAVYTATVIYLDKGLDTWKFSYTTYYGERQDKIVRKTDSQKWVAQTWRLPDMYLNDALTNTVDICLNSNGDGNDFFHMFLLEAKGKAAPAPTPAPTVPPNMPEVRIGDLQDRTESLQERLERILRIFQGIGQ
jgi:hypothetical protein